MCTVSLFGKKHNDDCRISREPRVKHGSNNGHQKVKNATLTIYCSRRSSKNTIQKSPTFFLDKKRGTPHAICSSIFSLHELEFIKMLAGNSIISLSPLLTEKISEAFFRIKPNFSSKIIVFEKRTHKKVPGFFYGPFFVNF